MIESFIYFIQETLLPLGSVGIFIAILLEQFIAPIPSSIVQFGAGFIFLSGLEFGSFDFWYTLLVTISIPTALAVTLVAIVMYYIVFLVGKNIIDKWGCFIGIDWHDVQKVHRYFERDYGHSLIFLVIRLIPIIPISATNVFAGLIRFDLWKYIYLTFVSMYVRAVVSSLVGFKLGELYFKYHYLIEKVELLFLIAIVILICWFVWYRRKIILKRRSQGIGTKDCLNK